LLGMGAQIPPALLAADHASPLENLLQGTEPAYQLAGSLFPYAWHSRNIVGSVTGQPENIRHQLRRNSKAVQDLLRPGSLLFHGVEQSDPVIHNLQQILVTGDDRHMYPFRSIATG